ncbi:hypothetical protein Syun_000208 [Stephania yunnanensis]|uniref:Uncharacterized protein n=1 Tax=Stephania yunnanensis TaxID=152371 RepID=A0AAP0Q5T4_9MAGN
MLSKGARPGNLLCRSWYHNAANLRLCNVLHYHGCEEHVDELPSSEWYEEAFPRLTKMAELLKDVDMIDGKIINVKDGSAFMNDGVSRRIQMFKSLARTFIGSPSVQQSLEKKAVASTAQQRKSVRLAICPQVTQQRIWTGALEEILEGLKSDVKLLYSYRSLEGDFRMSEQIISSCFQFLANAKASSNPDSTSWMRLTPMKKSDSPPSSKWGNLLEMFNDLTKCLASDKDLLYHLSKLELVKEGLYQIKDVLVDRDIGYKETRHQENLVQKKLTKTLGHSSRCLFTLLQHYLCGSVLDIEVEVCGGVYDGSSKGNHCLCVGKILASDEENMVRHGVKQLDRALRLFKFVWEIAGMQGVLELQGHIWCVGDGEKTLKYRGNLFFLHGIKL